MSEDRISFNNPAVKKPYTKIAFTIIASALLAGSAFASVGYVALPGLEHNNLGLLHTGLAMSAVCVYGYTKCVRAISKECKLAIRKTEIETAPIHREKLTMG